MLKELIASINALRGDKDESWSVASNVIIDEVIKIIASYKPKERDKPDSEGWWWYKVDGLIVNCVRIVRHGVYFYGVFDLGEVIIDNSFRGKWVKAIELESEENKS